MAKVSGTVLVAGIVANNTAKLGKAILARSPWWSEKPAHLRSMPRTATISGATARQLEARIKFGELAQRYVKGQKKWQVGGLPSIVTLSGRKFSQELSAPKTERTRVNRIEAMKAELARRSVETRVVGAPIRTV